MANGLQSLARDLPTAHLTLEDGQLEASDAELHAQVGIGKSCGSHLPIKSQQVGFAAIFAQASEVCRDAPTFTKAPLKKVGS